MIIVNNLNNMTKIDSKTTTTKTLQLPSSLNKSITSDETKSMLNFSHIKDLDDSVTNMSMVGDHVDVHSTSNNKSF